MIRMLQKNRLLRSLYFNREEMEQVIILSGLFSVALVLFRAAVTRDLFFFFLPWNLFLAFIPFAITQWLSSRVDWIESSPKFLVLFFVWLLFIPNSFYIITDLFHLGKGGDVPRWYDLALIFSFAWNGLLLGVLSVRRMEQMICARFTFLNGLWFVIPIMGLNALGIYIGRYLRYNSWDIITDPISLISDILYLVIHPLQQNRDWGMILSFTMLLVLIYEGLKKVAKGERMRK